MRRHGDEDQIFIAVPALVSEELFAVVQAQLEENRRRRRTQSHGDRYLLQGLVVCKRCGYGCYGKPTSRASTKGKVRYAYYRCTGSDAYRFGGQRLCWNKQVRTDLLDAAVWEDVRSLLSEPRRIKQEYDRRQRKTKPEGKRAVDQLAKLIKQVKKSIARLIDAYEEGLLRKSEFEPRIKAARERLSRLEEERERQTDQEIQESEFRLVIGQLEEFARRISEELQEPDWLTRREIIRALVKQVEINEGEVRAIYRVGPSPFEGAPNKLVRNIVGGVVSPMLSNLFLHYVLDQWFEQEVKPRLTGEAFLIRYADDFVIGAAREDDAQKDNGCLAQADEQVRLDGPPGEDTPGAVRTARG